MVALVGAPRPGLLRELGRAANVVAIEAERGSGLEAAAALLRRAEAASAPYAVLAADPLEELKTQWLALWRERRGPEAFEQAAGRAVAAWRSGSFELPDYYVVLAGEARGPAPHHDDLHLGLLRTERPARVVAVAPEPSLAAEVTAVLGALSSLSQGPWWPPLDELVARARAYFPGGLGAAAEVL